MAVGDNNPFVGDVGSLCKKWGALQTPSLAMEWIKGESEPTALDVRDDRIHLFVNADAAKQRYYYAVRAVSLGNFKQGPVSADAMYNGEYHSYHGAGVVRVVR